MKKWILIVLLFQIATALGQQEKLKDSIQMASPSKKVVIRCCKGCMPNNPPMYVMDGKILSKEEVSVLNPGLIDSIYVLKNEFSISNRPIVIIRTKKATKLSKMKKNKN